jgi:hypothetical protein
MNDDFESLVRLSEHFKDHIVNKQKKINEIRANQFQSMQGDQPKINFGKIRERHREFQRREESQLKILTDEMNNMVVEKIKKFEGKSFKIKELMQEKILLDELKKERSKQINDALVTLSEESEAPLMPLIVHVDMLLQKQELSEEQKNHLRKVRENVLSGLDKF